MDAIRTTELGRTLVSLFSQYEKDRKSWEDRMLQNYRQYRGEYDPEVANAIDKNRSKAYPKVTRVKCISVVARLMQMLFPVSEKNWGIEPSPVPNMSEEHLRAALASVPEGTPDEMIEAAIKEYAAARAKKMELEMDDQLVELGGTKELPYLSLCKKVIQHGTKYGLGILKGPLVRAQDQTRWRRNTLSGQVEVFSAQVYRPYYEVTSPWNYYPDLSAKTFCGMDGQFERHPMNRREVLALVDRPGYDGDQIKAFVAAHPDGNFRWRTFETELRQMGPQERAMDARGKFEAVSYWGEVKVGQLREALGSEAPVAPDLEDDDMVEAQVWMLDQYPIKAEINAYQPHMRPYHHFVFEEDDSSLAGEGLPLVLRDSQLGVSASTRMMVDNAAVTAGPMYEVQDGLLAAGSDAQTIHAFKVWHRDDHDQPSAQYPAIREIRVSSHIPDLMNVMALFKGFADDESFVSPALSGDFQNTAKEPFRTAQGGSMYLSGAMLPFRDVVRNFDAFTLSVMTALTQWNMQFNDKDEIKGDYQIVARGSTSLMAKEVRAQALAQFSATLRPEEAAHVNFRDVVVEKAKVLDLPDRTILSEEQVEQNRKEQAARAERDAQLPRELLDAQIKETVAAAVQKLSQAKKAGAGADKLIAEIVQDATGNGPAS